MQGLIIGLALFALVLAVTKKQGTNVIPSQISIGPMRPYVKLNGTYREVLHRRRSKSGEMLICTLRPEYKGGNRTKVAIAMNDVQWLPKGSYQES